MGMIAYLVISSILKFFKSVQNCSQLEHKVFVEVIVYDFIWVPIWFRVGVRQLSITELLTMCPFSTK